MPNIWSPDTCSCEVMVEGTAVMPGIVVVSVNRKDLVHTAIADALLGPVLLDECGRKNGAIAIMLSFVPAVTGDQVQWSFNALRVLLLSAPAAHLTAKNRTDIQNACDLQYGPGKVLVS